MTYNQTHLTSERKVMSLKLKSAICLIPLSLLGCMAEDKDPASGSIDPPAVPRFDADYGRPSELFRRVNCIAGITTGNQFATPDYTLYDEFSDHWQFVIPTLRLQFFDDVTVSFEIKVEDEAKTVAFSFGEQFCWWWAGVATSTFEWRSATAYYDFETALITPNEWQAVEISKEIFDLASSSYEEIGFVIRLTEDGSFNLKNVKIKRTDGSEDVLVP